MVGSGDSAGILSVPSRPANLDNSRLRASVLAVGADGGWLDIFSLAHQIFFSLISMKLA